MTFTHVAELYRSVGKSKKCTFIFCADHGVAKENVSAYPQTTTADMVRNYLVEDGAAANAFAKFAYSELYVVDVGVDADIADLPGLVDRKISRGTKNIAEEPAMTFEQAMQSVRIGKTLAEEAIAAGCNCFLIGEMGIGNTTAAAAMTAAYLNLPPEKVTGRGSNIDDEKFAHKVEI
ncbi:MAG: nicotinate-nucleotide--dimethylbenzimidazole phosphoribosyltransferase, partial [Selenomonadaceae bacterium]|nr:nicotinate-nucleotide--dimethylbenzimidazole phosphoribosyltransferase [Selenomonadaceae bacterium]